MHCSAVLRARRPAHAPLAQPAPRRCATRRASWRAQETAERLGLIASCRAVLAGRKLHAVYQPVVEHQGAARGRLRGAHPRPGRRAGAARTCSSRSPARADMTLELESLCLETIFRRAAARARCSKKLFVNASPRLLAPPVFLDERNLADIRRAHPNVVVEISEKEVVHDYPAFREMLDRLRGAGLQIAIDDAGSGYSGLESILQLRPAIHQGREHRSCRTCTRTRSSAA